MAFTGYTDLDVFDRPIINVICNTIVTNLEDHNNTKNISQLFALTGTPAKILQGASSTDVQNVPFITSDDVLFNFLNNEVINFIPNVYDVLKRKEVLKFKFNSVFFEVHKADLTRTIVDVDGVFVQESSEIPNFIL